MPLLKLIIIAALNLCIIQSNGATNHLIYAQYSTDTVPSVSEELPIVNDTRLSVERVYTGLNETTNMAFLAENDILFLDGLSGKVQRIVNGQMLDKPLIDLNTYYQDGLLGIAVSKNETGPTYVFLYLNEAPKAYGSDVENADEAMEVNKTLGYDREGDRLYRFELINNKLVNPKLLIDLKITNQSKLIGDMHHGGELTVGPDNLVYLIVGDLDGWKYEDGRTKAQNYNDGKEPDGRAGILRVTQDGKPVDNGIIGDNYPLNLYYAYGIRNSFGMDFDPVTGKLWDTENGPDYGDEINLVEPGFNSGADDVYGMSFLDHKFNLNKLVTFGGKGKYSDPEFVWDIPIGPTAIKFIESNIYGDEFKNDLLVGDINNGNIYHFELNNKRDMLLLNGTLADNEANSKEEVKDIIFMDGFKGITDIQIGPEGYIYVLANGSIYKILPKKVNYR